MKRLAINLISALIMAIFMYAATSKLLEYNVFVAQISRSPMIDRFAGYVGWAVPSIEILIGIMLLVPRLRLIGLYGSFTIMYLFTGYIAIMLIFSPSLPCSCGGILSKMSWGQHLFFNIVVVLMCGVGIILEAKRRETDHEELFLAELQTTK